MLPARIQPQGALRLNPRSALTRGLALALVPSAGAVNLVSNPIKGNAALQKSVGPAGISLYDNGTVTSLSDVKAFDQPGEFTALTLCRRTGTIGSNTAAFARNFASNGAPSYCVFSIEYNQSGTGQNCLTAFGSVAGSFARTSNYLIPNGGETKPHVSGLVRRATSFSSYYNGVNVGTVSGLSAPSYSGGNDPYVFGLNSSSAMEVYVALYWQRALSDAEVAAVSANPWQLFDAPAGTVYDAALLANTNRARIGAVGTVGPARVQPQGMVRLSQKHPMARGIVDAWMPGVSTRGIVSGVDSSTVASGSVVATPAGVGFTTTATGRRYSTSIFNGQPVAWLIVATRDNSAPPGGYISIVRKDGAITPLQEYGGVVNGVSFNAITNAPYGNASAFAGKTSTFCGVASASERVVFANGGANVTLGGSMVSSANPLCIGATEAGAEVASMWNVHLVVAWQGANIPTSAQLRALQANPWQLFEGR